MNYISVVRTLGAILMGLGGTMLIPAAYGVYSGELGATAGLGVSAAITAGAGAAAWFLLQKYEIKIFRKEGFAVVAMSWILAGLFGALPYLFITDLTVVNCLFETYAGFTTTGSSILSSAVTPQIESLPDALLLWRSQTQWLGGMGIVLLFVAVLPGLGIGGKHLYRMEVPGPSGEGLSPRIKDTALVLWGIYLGLSALLFGALVFLGLTPFQAVNHAFTAMPTGGFSTSSNSIAGLHEAGRFGGVGIDLVFTLFMFFAGTNFALYFAAFRGKLRFWEDREFMTYVSIITGLVVIFTTVTMVFPWPEAGHAYASIGQSLRDALFQATSLITTTGYVTTDYGLWPHFAQGVILAIFVLGASAGSTGGGMKVIRFMTLVKLGRKALYKAFRPGQVLPVRIGDMVVDREFEDHVLGFMALLILIVIANLLILAAHNIEPLTALSATLTCVGNVGPGLGAVGPAESFGHLPPLPKLSLSFVMIAGRLELFTLLVLLVPSFWRR